MAGTQAKGAQGKKGGATAKKGKQGKKGTAAKAAGPSLCTHPRAGAQVRRAKGLGGLIGFALAALVSLKAGAAPADAGLRALAGGIGGYVVAWACAITVWRHLILAELRAMVEAGQLVRSAAPASEPADAAASS